MPREAANKPRKDDKEPKRFSFSLSTAGLVSLAVVSAAALAWVFILGVLVGRGYKPEQAVPQLAEIMPRAEEKAPEGEGVLKPEELQFFDALEQKPADQTAAPKAKAKEESKSEPKAPAKTAEARPEPAPEPSVAASTTSADGAQFNYIYQVGSLKNPVMAREFADRLNKLGLTTSIEEALAAGATWHRVLVHYTGTPASTAELKAVLATQGVKKPIMKSKVPLP